MLFSSSTGGAARGVEAGVLFSRLTGSAPHGVGVGVLKIVVGHRGLPRLPREVRAVRAPVILTPPPPRMLVEVAERRLEGRKGGGVEEGERGW